jgi:hypothetical protein
MAKSRTQNRRRSDRWPANTYASVSVDSQHGIGDSFAAVLDVSHGGIRIRTPQPPVRYTRLKLRIALGEELFELPCKCVRVTRAERGNYEVGFSFDPDCEEAITFLNAFEKRPDKPG